MKSKLTAVIFFAILLLAIGVRIVGLERCFFLDELRTINFSARPIPEMLDILKQEESYSPLLYFSIRGWMNFAENDIWIRLLFVAFGTLSVITVYLIGKYLVNSRYALISMFLMALMPMQVWVSQYVRGIAPSIFFSLLSTLFFLKLLRGGETGKNYYLSALFYVLASATAIYFFITPFL